MVLRSLILSSFTAALALAQPAAYTVAPGTKIPLSLINTISTKHSAAGDRVYLETSFPVLAGGRIVIPVGSYVAGTVTQIKKPGHVRGRGELYIRFDTLTLPTASRAISAPASAAWTARPRANWMKPRAEAGKAKEIKSGMPEPSVKPRVPAPPSG